MSKSRFIEQLNLYLDNELSDSESEAFLEELRADEEKRRIYNEYCRIHKACACISRARTRIRSSWRQRVYAVGGLAAACALVSFAGLRLYDAVDSAPGQADGFVANEVRFDVGPTSRQIDLTTEGMDAEASLAGLDSDAFATDQGWRRGLLLAQEANDPYHEQAARERRAAETAVGSWESVFHSRPQSGRGSFGMARSSVQDSSIYNPVYLRYNVTTASSR